MNKTLKFALVIFAGLIAACTGAARGDHEGWISPADLQAGWPGFRDQLPVPAGSEALANLQAIEQDVEIVAFFGTWCHDSYREIPRMLYLLEEAGNAHLSLRLYALNQQKQDAEGLAGEFAIERTPTFVVRIDDQEVGRIVESPRDSLARDLVAILQPVLKE